MHVKDSSAMNFIVDSNVLDFLFIGTLDNVT